MARMKPRKVARPIYDQIVTILHHRAVAGAIRRHYSSANNAATDPKEAGWWSEKGKGWFDLDADGEALRAVVIAASAKAEAASNLSTEAYRYHNTKHREASNALYRVNATRLAHLRLSADCDAFLNLHATNNAGETLTVDKYRAAAEATLASFLQTTQEIIVANCAALEAPEGLAYREAARVANEARIRMEELQQATNAAYLEAANAAEALAEHALAPRTRLADEMEATLMRDYMLTPSKVAELLKARDAGALEVIA